MRGEEFTFPFEELDIWQLAMGLAREVYAVSQGFPDCERYGLTDQVRRSATSVALNIAEGKGRYHYKDFGKYLLIARGSLYETVTGLYLAKDLKYLSQQQLTPLLSRCQKLLGKLSGLINHTRKS